MASPIKHIPPRRIFIGESVFFPLTSCTTIATNIRTTDIAGIKNNATIPIEKKQRNAIPTYTAQSSINNLFVNLFLQIVLALPSSSVDDLFSISCRPRISISLCAFVTLGVEISCSILQSFVSILQVLPPRPLALVLFAFLPRQFVFPTTCTTHLLSIIFF